MNSAAELEAYMNRTEERFFTVYPPDAPLGAVNSWHGCRKHIEQVRSGDILDVMMDTATPKATEFLVGLRRLLGEELHPRGKIRRRQLQALQAAGQPVPSPEEVAAFAQNIRQTRQVAKKTGSGD